MMACLCQESKCTPHRHKQCTDCYALADEDADEESTNEKDKQAAPPPAEEVAVAEGREEKTTDDAVTLSGQFLVNFYGGNVELTETVKSLVELLPIELSDYETAFLSSSEILSNIKLVRYKNVVLPAKMFELNCQVCEKNFIFYSTGRKKNQG